MTFTKCTECAAGLIFDTEGNPPVPCYLCNTKAGEPTPPDTLVNSGALKLALTVLRSVGKNTVADVLQSTAMPYTPPRPQPRIVITAVGLTFAQHKARANNVQKELP